MLETLIFLTTLDLKDNMYPFFFIFCPKWLLRDTQNSLVHENPGGMSDQVQNAHFLDGQIYT